MEHRICLACAYPVQDLPKCSECRQEVDAVTLRVWNCRRGLFAQRRRRLQRVLGVLSSAVLLCGLGMYGLCTAPTWGIGRASAALTDHWVANVLGAILLPSIAVVGAWVAPLPLAAISMPHNRLPMMCIWEASMWKFHVPWMATCVMGPIFGAFATFPLPAIQIIGSMSLLVAWAAICLMMAFTWVMSIKRQLHEASLLHTRAGVWLVLCGVPIFFAASVLGFLAGMFAAVRSMELWGTAGLF